MRTIDLSGLFPDGDVFIHAAWFDGEPAPLLPAEQNHIERAVPRRRREFAAGRDCARRCLVQAGLAPDLALLSDTDRAPIWPTGWTGSITHTLLHGRLFAGAVVASCSHRLSLGIDAEPCLPIPTDVVGTVLTPVETDRLTRRSAGDAEMMGVLTRAVFSAKECLYKAQPAQSRQMAGFDEVDIEFPDGLPAPEQAPLPFRFRRWDGLRGTGRVFCPAGLLITGVQISSDDGP